MRIFNIVRKNMGERVFKERKIVTKVRMMKPNGKRSGRRRGWMCRNGKRRRRGRGRNESSKYKGA